ncbi:MAG: DUF72 domain-containing protein, partial [Planctomycetota bacterium]|nr:DUF72 domain-containing protein [Planctomycetota bacterium]
METQEGLFEGPEGSEASQEAPPGGVRLGTSSWSERGWVGPFYPPGTAPAAFLAHYAREFTAVEADVTYYRVPSLRMVEGWRDRTPPSFRLCAKFPREVVHAGEGRVPDPGELLSGRRALASAEAFVGAMLTLGRRCGPLLLQFPWLSRGAFPEPGPFLERLAAFLTRLPREVRVAVEIRNQEWLREDLLAVLREAGAGLVLADLPRMEHPDTAPPGFDLLTSDFLYVRLIGDRRVTDALTSSFDRVVVDRDERIERWAEWLAPMSARATETFAFANNHFAGHGPATVRSFAAAL